MSRSQLIASLALIAGVLLVAWLAMRKGPPELGPDGRPLLPGDEVNVGLGRAAVIVEGDAVDPVEEVTVSRGGQTLPHEPPCWRKDRAGVVLFCDVDGGPTDVMVRTRYRQTRYAFTPETSRNGVLLQPIDLRLPEQAPVQGVPDTALAFSPDSQRLAIGSAAGELRVCLILPATGEKAPPACFQQSVAEGIAKSLAFSADGSVLVVGEQSPDGFVRGLDAADGKELWRFRLADDLGTSRAGPDLPFPLYQFPGAYRILALSGGDVLVLGLHSWQPDAATRAARSRVYRFDAKTGALRWRYPADKPEERNMTWMDATSDGKRVVMTKTMPGAGQADSKDGSLDVVALDADGHETGHLTLPPLEPHFNSIFFWQALSIGGDGASALLGVDDGRLWALNLDGEGRMTERWRMDLGIPRRVGGMDVHCSIGWTLSGQRGFFAELDRSWEKFGAGANTGLPQDLHPEAASIQAFDPADPRPQRLWRYDVDGRPQGLWQSPDQRWLAFACEKPEGTDARGRKLPPDYGVMMFDLSRRGTGAQKLTYRQATEGPLSFAGLFSPNSRFLAVTEGPRPGADRLSSSSTYRVLILH
jgi:outer membrane protein assembly factor BamB